MRVKVDTKGERGLLGVATVRNDNTKSSDSNSTLGTKRTLANQIPVFLYFTETNDNNTKLRNRIYMYDWTGENLINPSLILDLPAKPGPYHQGGKLKIGPDNNLYAVIGDLTSPNGVLLYYQFC